MRALAILCAACAALALLTGGGTAPFGRVLMAGGLPGLAAPLFTDPGWRGAALYRAGQMEAAEDGFRDARAFLNLGNALVRQGSYAAALEAYDIAISAGDPDAQANFDLVASFYAGLAIDPEALALFAKREEGAQAEGFVARGNARAAGTGDEVTNTNTMMGLAQLESSGEQQRVRQVFDDKFMVANDRWLEQLSDVPGEYLKARISHERKRRAKAGLAPPDPEDPR